MFARKIDRNHWNPDLSDFQLIGADAITLSMRTGKNALSNFEIPTETDVDKAFLALASNCERVDSFDIVLLEKEDLESLGLKCMQTPAQIKVPSLVNTHWDVCELNYSKLGQIAKYINERIKAGRSIRRTKQDIIGILKHAIIKKELDPETLPNSLRKDLGILPKT